LDKQIYVEVFHITYGSIEERVLMSRYGTFDGTMNTVAKIAAVKMRAVAAQSTLSILLLTCP